MRKLFLAGVAALALIATAAPALAEVPESTDPIKIANFDWTGAVLNTKILAKILERGHGLPPPVGRLDQWHGWRAEPPRGLGHFLFCRLR